MIRCMFCTAGAILGALFIAPAYAQNISIPDFSGTWARQVLDFEQPLSGPGPVVNRVHRPSGIGSNLQMLVGDYTNPILKPQAAEQVKRLGNLASTNAVFPDPYNQCLAMPTPYILAMREIQLLQQEDAVTIVYMWDHMVRRVRMNASHPAHIAPTWQGDSVGYYEGDTLVVDTIGIKPGPFPMVDRFGTPHSGALHVTERYRLIDHEIAKAINEKYQAEQGYRVGLGEALGDGVIVDSNYVGKGLQVQFTVEDENVFTMPWSGQVTYLRAGGQWLEQSCAENTRESSGLERVMPHTETPDF